MVMEGRGNCRNNWVVFGQNAPDQIFTVYGRSGVPRKWTDKIFSRHFIQHLLLQNAIIRQFDKYL